MGPQPKRLACTCLITQKRGERDGDRRCALRARGDHPIRVARSLPPTRGNNLIISAPTWIGSNSAQLGFPQHINTRENKAKLVHVLLLLICRSLALHLIYVCDSCEVVLLLNTSDHLKSNKKTFNHHTNKYYILYTTGNFQKHGKKLSNRETSQIHHIEHQMYTYIIEHHIYIMRTSQKTL
jgi:hypothetical protein